MPPPHSSARAGNSGSKRRNMWRAQAGMFDQIARPSTPSGAMSPVDTSSGTTISTRPSIASGTGTGAGGATMFDPFTISTPRPSSGGCEICRSSIAGSPAGGSSRGGSPSPRGSVISPWRAVAAAVAGEHR